MIKRILFFLALLFIIFVIIRIVNKDFTDRVISYIQDIELFSSRTTVEKVNPEEEWSTIIVETITLDEKNNEIILSDTDDSIDSEWLSGSSWMTWSVVSWSVGTGSTKSNIVETKNPSSPILQNTWVTILSGKNTSWTIIDTTNQTSLTQTLDKDDIKQAVREVINDMIKESSSQTTSSQSTTTATTPTTTTQNSTASDETSLRYFLQNIDR